MAPHDPHDSDATEAKAYGPVRLAQGVRLTVLNGAQSGESAVLRLGAGAGATKAVLGRSQASDFRIADSTASSFHVEVSVRDTGVGISPDDQEAVFEEFRQVGTASKKIEGTGLGLSLCRRFVELHGGRIWVTSQLGAGSTFTFAIPTRSRA